MINPQQILDVGHRMSALRSTTTLDACQEKAILFNAPHGLISTPACAAHVELNNNALWRLLDRVSAVE
jgi:hypothetical protein